jgi:acetolactate synthase-1/3 small subunit
MDGRFTIGLIVLNHHGVLNRIAGLYGKRGYNIDSLAVGETEDPRYSRMTIVSTGDEYIRTQILRQLRKLHDVKSAALLESEEAISVEHLLIKLRVNGEGTAPLAALVNDYGGKIVDFGDRFLTADLTGPTERMQEFIARSAPFGILELCRSGSLSLSRGTDKILSIQGIQ